MSENIKRNQAIGNLVGQAKRKLLDASKADKDLESAAFEFINSVGSGLAKLIPEMSNCETECGCHGSSDTQNPEFKVFTPEENAEAERKHSEWHENRYGEGRKKIRGEHLNEKDLEQVVEMICGKNYDAEAATGLILLMDEIERSVFQTLDICSIASTVERAAFKYTLEHNEAVEALVKAQRASIHAGGAQ